MKEKKEDNSALVFVGALMVGMAVGFIIQNIVAGIFFGLGSGFLLMYFAKLLTKNS